MDWLAIDSLLLLYVMLKLVDFLVHAGVAFFTAQGWLSDDFSHGVLNFIH